jgi:hypothetical protein
MIFSFLMGCFSPVSGEWGIYDVVQSGDCSVDSAQSLDDFVSLDSNGNEFSFTRDEDGFSCSLTGQDFLCTSEERALDLDEVSLQVIPSATGTFSSSAEGTLRIAEKWSCISGSCETYGLSECTNMLEGVMGLFEAE